MAQGIVVNPEQLAALKACFVNETGNVHDLTTRIGGQLEGTQWEGHVADTFRQDWANTYAPMLHRLAEALQQASVDVQTALDRALSADGQA
jgi:uncharacterized protein YukE